MSSIPNLSLSSLLGNLFLPQRHKRNYEISITIKNVLQVLAYESSLESERESVAGKIKSLTGGFSARNER